MPVACLASSPVSQLDEFDEDAGQDLGLQERRHAGEPRVGPQQRVALVQGAVALGGEHPGGVGAADTGVDAAGVDAGVGKGGRPSRTRRRAAGEQSAGPTRPNLLSTTGPPVSAALAGT